MISMGVCDEHNVDIAEAGISPASHCHARVIQNSHAGRVLEKQSPVGATEFTGASAERCNYNILGQYAALGQHKTRD
jgi:hypothetical protein